MTYRFVDCRWELGDPGRGRELYLAGHIPGAAFLNVEQDLSAAPGPRGRHPLPAAEDFAAAASRAGIGPGVLVVAYGSMGGAERLWWLLRHFGHEDVAVLAGGIEAWRGPLATGDEEIEEDRFEARPRTGSRSSEASEGARAARRRGSRRARPRRGRAPRARSTRPASARPRARTRRPRRAPRP